MTASSRANSEATIVVFTALAWIYSAKRQLGERPYSNLVDAGDAYVRLRSQLTETAAARS
jgi:hypothetical protein